MLYKFYMFWVSFKIIVCGCQTSIKTNGFEKAKSRYEIKKIGKLPPTINESSGIIKVRNHSNLFLINNDSGGKNVLYSIDEQGTIKDSIVVKNATNIDWEDLTQDDKENIYIGDFGNNSQARKDLSIYKVNKFKTEKITFHYANQEQFPSKEAIFDCEAFFWYENKLYLFSKDWTKKHETILYILPDKAGDYVLFPEKSIRIKAIVTAADISPNQKEFALLSYGKILIFNIDNNKIDFNSPKYCLKMKKQQTEALSYINDTDFLITNEQKTIFLVRKK